MTRAMGDAEGSGRSRSAGWKLPILRRVLRRRCPQCGLGPLFQAYGRLRASCPDCGLVYRREPGAQTGSMYLSAAVTQVFAAGVIAVLVLTTDWGFWPSIAVGGPVVLGFCLVFLPWSQALWTGVEYATDLHNGEPWARPRAEGR